MGISLGKTDVVSMSQLREGDDYDQWKSTRRSPFIDKRLFLLWF